MSEKPRLPDDLELLLGGYATGTLTPEEHEALMQAALGNQALFDALMDEEALRETLDDPATREALLKALAPAQQKGRSWRWAWAGLATATMTVALFVLLQPGEKPAPQSVAMGRLPVTARPEPQPVEIHTPSQLKLSEAPAPAPAEAQQVAKAEAVRDEQPPARSVALPAPQQEAASREAASGPTGGAIPGGTPGGVIGGIITSNRPQGAPPPPPPPAMAAPAPAAPVVLERLQAYSETKKSVADAVSRNALEADKESNEALRVEVQFQTDDGVWRRLSAGTPAPAGRNLRLMVTSQTAGTLNVTPAIASSVELQAGEAAPLLIGPRSPGELKLTLGLRAGRQVEAMAKMKGRAERARADAAPAKTDSGYVQREFRLMVQ